MRSIVTVTTAPSVTRLTTVERFKQELDITDGSNDALIAAKIDEATSDIESHIARTLARATLTETFWMEWENRNWCVERLSLVRAPIASITSVTLDDEAIDTDETRLDAEAGLLYRLDADGNPSRWEWSKSIIVVYAGGYLLPGQSGRNLPYALESAALDLVSSYWASRGRDRLIKSEDVPGLGSVSYWVGAVGAAGDLPPDVMSKIMPFRRIVVA